MKDIINIIKFTMFETIKKRTFIITNIILVLVIIIATNVPNVYNYFKGDSKELDKVLVVDKDNLFQGSLEYIDDDTFNAKIDVVNKNFSKKELADKVGKYKYVINVINENNTVTFENYATNVINSFSSITLVMGLQNIYKSVMISNLNLSIEQTQLINPTFEIVDIDSDNLDKEETNDFMQTVAIASSLILFMGITIFSQQVSLSITTEKTSKIIEVLLTSTKSSNIVLGKTLGTGIVSILQMLFLIILAIVSSLLFLPDKIVDQILLNNQIDILSFAIIFIYFVLGYFLYSFIFALTGSTVNKTEDIQIANMPVSLILAISFYLAYFAQIGQVNSLMNIASYLPFSTAFIMPSRIIGGTACNVDIIVTLLILLISIMFISFVSIRVYSNSILNNGVKLNFKTIKNLIFNKDNI